MLHDYQLNLFGEAKNFQLYLKAGFLQFFSVSIATMWYVGTRAVSHLTLHEQTSWYESIFIFWFIRIKDGGHHLHESCGNLEERRFHYNSSGAGSEA